MADLLGQLFAYTEVFDMETRPELILLQKSMVIVEGVARTLDPTLNMWTAAEPIAREWIDSNYGIAGRVREAGAGAGDIARVLADVPSLMQDATRAAHAFADMARDGVRLDPPTISAIASEQAEHTRSGRIAAWIIAIALAAIAWAILLQPGH